MELESTPRNDRDNSTPADRLDQTSSGAAPETGTKDSNVIKVADAVERKVSTRLVSLDVFRGLTIFGMLLVNNIALDQFTPKYLIHAQWNAGVTIADMVFPWFLLIVGVAIPYSIASFRRRNLSGWRLGLKIVGRASVLVLLGCLIDSSIIKQPIFDLGVLQIIGLAYMFASFLYWLPVAPRLTIALAFLLAHWAAIRFLPVPGLGVGAFCPNENFIAYIDRMYLQVYHLNGLLSVVPTSALVVIGSVIGDLVRSETYSQVRKTIILAVAGAVMAVAGYVWNLDLPFNKPLWTASYILFTAGLGAIALALLYLVTDVKGWRAWSFPFVVFGMNAIAAYVFPILLKLWVLQIWKWPMPDGSNLTLQQAMQHVLIVHAGRIPGGWLYTFCYIFAWWLVLLWMYRNRVFLRV